MAESYTIRDGIKVIDRIFELPLDYSRPNERKIQIFARNTIPLAKAKTTEEQNKLPYLLYLQVTSYVVEGGPGFEVGLQGSSGFAGEIYKEGYQILWLDQRGTGLSTAVSPETLESHTDSQIAEYLKHFRADSIVQDCEAIRKELLGERENPEDRKWTVLGQSFGGFCATTYLSFYPEGLKEVFLTGGLPPLTDDPDAVYRRTFAKVAERNQVYYKKYPKDVQRVRGIMKHLSENEVNLPNGGRLTSTRWQQLGLDFGGHGGIDAVHQLVLRADSDLRLFKKLSYKILQNVEQVQSFDGNPIYAVLHEAIYCQGHASRWSAARILNQYSEFQWDLIRNKSEDTPIFFTGEMIFPSMFDDYRNLRPLKGAAELLAQEVNWPALYDRAQLEKNQVKVTAATYMEDMYVAFDLAQETAKTIRNTEQFITNQLYHTALRHSPEEVISTLFRISRREID